MSKKTGTLPLFKTDAGGTTHKAVDKRRRALEKLFDSMPMQIDAIKHEKENAAIELRRFTAQREKSDTIKQLNRRRLNAEAAPYGGLFEFPVQQAYLSQSTSKTPAIQGK